MRIVVDLAAGTTTQVSGVADDLPNEPSRVPVEISKVQFVRAMRQLGLWDTYKATIEADEDWPYITQMPRDNATLNASANAVLGAETGQALLDQVFVLGASL